MENESNTLLSELDTLETRLHRAHSAICIDALVAYLSKARKQMLQDEERTKTGANLAGFPALGIYGLFCLFGGQKPNWGRAASAAFKEEPFGDVRVASSWDGIKAVNISKMAREQNMSVAEVVAYLEKKGNKVLSWPEFEARARALRIAALNGQLTFPEKGEPAKLQMRVHNSFDCHSNRVTYAQNTNLTGK